MDHPEVRAWLEEAALQPGRLDDPSDPAIAAHLDRCDRCAAERESLRATIVALDLVMGPPMGARQRVLDNVRELGRERRPQRPADPGPSPRRVVGDWLRTLSPRLAAGLLGLAVVLVAAGALAGALVRGPEAPSRLPGVVTAMAEIGADPQASHVALRDTAGEPMGMLVYSPTTARLAVVSAELPAADETSYWCYLERDGTRMPVGPMHLEGDTHFWAGPMRGPADAGREGDRFLVMVEGSDGPPVLVGEF